MKTLAKLTLFFMLSVSCISVQPDYEERIELHTNQWKHELLEQKRFKADRNSRKVFERIWSK